MTSSEQYVNSIVHLEYNMGLPSSSQDARGLHPCTPQNWQSPRWAKGHPTKMATQGYQTTEINQWFSNLSHFFDIHTSVKTTGFYV